MPKPDRTSSAATTDPATRIAEIRQENRGGDVSSRDIDWLLAVAEASLWLMTAPLLAAQTGARQCEPCKITLRPEERIGKRMGDGEGFFCSDPDCPIMHTPEPVIVQGNASYVLDWLRQTEAPSNIIRLQETAVAQLGGYLGAVARQVRQ